MSSHQPVVDLLDPPTLARALKSRAATRHACAAPTLATDADADADATATRIALDAAEKCVALLRAELNDDNVGGGADGKQPSAKRRAVERKGGQVVAVSSAITTTVPAPGVVVGTVSADTNRHGTGTTTLSSTKTIHKQLPDGTWATTVVPCAPREIVVTTRPSLSSTLLHVVMESDLRELVLGCLVSRDLVAVRIASMGVHEAMMDTALDLWDMGQYLTVDQARALARLTKLHKFKLAPARCVCAAANALGHLDLGATVSDTRVASQEMLGLGLGQSWRLTGLRMRGEVRAGEFGLLIRDFISATVITKLGCCIMWGREDEEEDEEEAEWLDFSSVSHLALLTHL